MFKVIRNCCLVIGAILMALPCSGLTLGELEKSYENKCAEILNAKKESLESLRKSYLGELERIANKYQRAGRLDEVLLVKAESQSIEDGKWPLSALPDKISLETSAPRKIYLRKHIEIAQQTAKDLVQTADTMTKALDGQIASLTKAGDLTNAKLAQTIRDNLGKNPEISSARNLVANVRSDGSSRPALRIRRGGDNMEVIVRYDMRGKISLDSPVSNVEEKDKSIGDTSAELLGEFVGAKNYEADPYVIFEKTLDGADMGGIDTGADVAFKIGEKVEEEVGIAFSLKENAKNPTVYIPVALPTKSAGGITRVTFKYLIPKSNKAVTGFRLVSGGLPYGDKAFTENGKWITDSVTSEPSSDDAVLYLYFNYDPENQQNRPHEDKIVIGAIKVEQIRFTAFVVQRLGESGVVAENFDDPESQPRFISNGELVFK